MRWPWLTVVFCACLGSAEPRDPDDSTTTDVTDLPTGDADTDTDSDSDTDADADLDSNEGDDSAEDTDDEDDTDTDVAHSADTGLPTSTADTGLLSTGDTMDTGVLGTCL